MHRVQKSKTQVETFAMGKRPQTDTKGEDRATGSKETQKAKEELWKDGGPFGRR